MGKLYINIDKDYFDKTKEQANIKSKEDNNDSKDYLWNELDFRVDTLELDKGTL